MLSYSAYLLVLVGCLGLYLWIRKMAKAGSPFFKVGYMLYTKTRIGYYYYRREVAKAKEKFESGHSVTSTTQYEDLKITPIPMSEDNYAYHILDDTQKICVLVDPADPESVRPYLEKEGINPTAILTTHKHWDHSGGNAAFKDEFPDVKVYGGAMDSVPGMTNPVADGDTIELGRMKFKAVYTPGHTVGHVVYILDGSTFKAPDSLFSGDHIFLGGCGRMFEGSPATMLRSLDNLCTLRDDTLMWPGHEYALDNLEFAVTLEPDNEAAKVKQQWVREQRKTRQCTSPSTIGAEKDYNPFLRTSQATIQQAVGIEVDAELEPDIIRAKTLGEVRARKDKFKYKL